MNYLDNMNNYQQFEGKGADEKGDGQWGAWMGGVVAIEL
jgi:hypothetical protein